MALGILSAGAAQSVVSALAARHGVALAAQFGAVGAMQERFDAGTPCDLVVLTQPQIEALRATGRVARSGDLGRVRTGIAVRSGDPQPDVSNAAALRAAFVEAQEIHHPDAVKSTAGIHFAKVLDALGIAQQVAPRLRAHPNGATAMRALAASHARLALGCTQITEIRNTPGVVLVSALPREFELITTYTAGLCSADAGAQAFFELLTGPRSAALRADAGFEI